MAKYKNLEAEMVRCGLKKEDLAEELNITPHTVRRKLNGEIGIAIDEARKIQNCINEAAEQNFTIDFLFAGQIMTANNSIFGANARIIGFAWYELLEKFYSNPENEAKFQKWLKEKENKQNEKNIKFE